jgi:hypothetical protein
MGEETFRNVPVTRRWGKQERGSAVPQSSISSCGWFSRWHTPSMCGKRMATHKTGKCPVGKHGVPIFSQWRSAATLAVVLPLVYRAILSIIVIAPGRHAGAASCMQEAFPACGCICFSPFKQQCAPMAGVGLQGLAVFKSIFPF